MKRVETKTTAQIILFHFVSVITILREDNDYMIFSLWLATVGTVCGALLFAGFSAIFAVINTASNPICTMASVPGLYLWNILASKL